jgi:hypothetical protein
MDWRCAAGRGARKGSRFAPQLKGAEARQLHFRVGPRVDSGREARVGLGGPRQASGIRMLLNAQDPAGIRSH